MTQNLRLVGSRTLTTTDTDTASNFTLPASAGGKWASVRNSPTTAEVATLHLYNTGNVAYGVYYNWYTATARSGVYGTSSGNIDYSICAKNWKLPTLTEWQTFYNAYGNWAGVVDNAGLVKGGTYRNGSVIEQGTNGNYWTATAYNNVRASNVWISNDLTSNTTKVDGYSVRCVAR